MAKTRRTRRRRRPADNALSVVRRARDAAKNALESLRNEIKATSARLQKLVTEERSFRFELFGGGGPPRGTGARRGGAPSRAATQTRGGRRGRARARRPPTRRARRRGKPQAEKYFSKLANVFSLDDVRKLAGRKAGISLAQWSRAKRIRRSGDKYQKVS